MSAIGRRAAVRPAKRRAAAIVETAIVIPPLLLFALAGADLGRSIHQKTAVANAARAGAEYGSTHPRSEISPQDWEARVIEAVELELSDTPSVDLARLAVTVSTSVDSSGLRAVRVEVSLPFETVIA